MILSPDFPDHYKTRILIRLAGHSGVYSLLKLWSQCQFRKCEKITKPPAVIAAIADWEGDPEALENALTESGYGHREGDSFVLHQWEEHNARLTGAWTNGKKGGRPKTEKQEKPKQSMKL
jgi:hypothetical protein